MNGRLAVWTEAILGFDLVQVELEADAMLDNAMLKELLSKKW
jgi:hypothetical protein